ncbi:MAG: NAD(P)H-binding protein [Proteobacteria bacterium]|nr:NAD(P)H-binding protein [Pseudomonadota bacterium]
MTQHIVVAGSTGLVGTEVLAALADRPQCKVTALVRRLTKRTYPQHIRERAFDFSAPSDVDHVGTSTLPCDVLLCCIGTTIATAGSRDAFEKVDRDIPVGLAQALARHRADAVFGLVSAIGAAQPRGFYLQTKAAAEAAVISTGLRYVIVRPSLLLGDRQEFRFGEQLGGLLIRPLFGAVDLLGLSSLSAVARVRPIQAKQLARVLISACLDHPPTKGDILEGQALFKAPP